jgi:hypothetical protein
VDCSNCGHPAAVLHGEAPLCGACFYQRSVASAAPVTSDDAPTAAMWRRLSEAITSLEVIASRIASEMNELVKRSEQKDRQK